MHKYSDKDENQKKIPLSTTYSSTKFSGHSSPDEINNQSEVHKQRNLQEKVSCMHYHTQIQHVPMEVGLNSIYLTTITIQYY